MLVMSRRPGESILIGQEIEIVIVQAGRSRVKIGIRAPREVTVAPGEVQAVREENLSAAGTPLAQVPSGSMDSWVSLLRGRSNSAVSRR
jgi:carbon storage regulator